MPWHLTRDVEQFHDTAGDFLRSRPIEHTVPLTLLHTLRTRDLHAYGPEDPIFGWWRGQAGGIGGAFLQTPPFPLFVAAGPAVPELVDLLADHPLPAVNAPAAVAEAFAQAWQARTGATACARASNRLFRLGTLTPPVPPPPGAARTAGPTDRDLLVTWLDAFHLDVDGSVSRDSGELVDQRLEYGGFTVWEAGGEPVSMAGRTITAAGVCRIGPVYTPTAHRARGYAAGATAAATQAALDSGATDVVLYTDLANPTSNALYRRLGYRRVEDRVVLEFTS